MILELRKIDIVKIHRYEAIEDETHFTVNCPLYNEQRKLLFDIVNTSCPNFKELPMDKKYFWLFTNEHLPTKLHYSLKV